MFEINLQLFGGRGSSSGFVIRHRLNQKWSGSNVGGRIAESLKEAIGSKGTPKSLGDAVVETNPNHSYDYREFSENCQRCVVAYELRRRGYDVEALPTYRGDDLGSVPYVDAANNLYMGRWRGAFQGAKTEYVGATGNNAEAQVLQNIADKMHGYGSGSRAVIQIFYKAGGGHVFNVENQGGRIVYVEAQTGRMKNVSQTMSYVDTSSVNIIRTDNLKISERAKNFVTKK